MPVAICLSLSAASFLVGFVLGFCLDENCNPGWGDCGRPLRLGVGLCCLTEDRVLANVFLFIGDWTIGSDRLEQEKIEQVNVSGAASQP